MWRNDIERLGIEPGDAGAPYDRKAATYDWLVRRRLYNRLLWATDPRDYEAFATDALAWGDGPVLDVAVGSAASTAVPHARSGRETVLLDRSSAMLERARDRIAAAIDPAAPPPIRFIQADALTIPLPPHGFETVLCMGFVHLLDDPRALLDGLRAQARPGGRIHVTSLVAERPIGRRYLNGLHRAGEVATPRTAAELERALGVPVDDVRGSMAYLRVDV